MNSKGVSDSKVKKETKDELKRIKCMFCDKMLGKLKGTVEIKCPKCKGCNSFTN